MNEWLLTDEEIEDVLREDICWLERDERKTWHFVTRDDFRDVAKAQAKNLVEWLDKRIEHVLGRSGEERILLDMTIKQWQALRKEVGLE